MHGSHLSAAILSPSEYRIAVPAALALAPIPPRPASRPEITLWNSVERRLGSVLARPILISRALRGRMTMTTVRTTVISPRRQPS